MKAKLIYLSERQVEFLALESKKLGTKVSELIRRILDAHIKKECESQDNITDGLVMSHLARAGKLTEYLEHPGNSSG